MRSRFLGGRLTRVLQATPVRSQRTIAASMSRAGCASAAEVSHLVDSVTTFVFDLDGVVWKGTDIVPNAPEVMSVLDACAGRVSPVLLWRRMPLHPLLAPSAPPCVQTLRALRQRGKRLLFCTNNSSKSRQQYVGKFAALGIEAAAHEIVGSAYAAAAYLQSLGGFQPPVPTPVPCSSIDAPLLVMPLLLVC